MDVVWLKFRFWLKLFFMRRVRERFVFFSDPVWGALTIRSDLLSTSNSYKQVQSEASAMILNSPASSQDREIRYSSEHSDSEVKWWGKMAWCFWANLITCTCCCRSLSRYLYRFTIQLYGVSKYDLTWRSFDALDFGEIEYALYNSSSSKKTDESEEEDEEESSSTCCCRSLNMRCTIAAAILLLLLLLLLLLRLQFYV